MSNRQTKRFRARDERRAERAEGAERLDTETIARPRTKPREFLREVRQELRKVAWPSRHEVTNYTVVVVVATAILMAIVFGMDFVFGRLVFTIFEG